MSWNKLKYEKIYKRQQHPKFDYSQYMVDDIFDADLHAITMFYYYDDWADLGNPKSMKELGMLRVLTLLHKLKLKEAMPIIDRVGWDTW